jgi:hypothetical protein
MLIVYRLISDRVSILIKHKENNMAKIKLQAKGNFVLTENSETEKDMTFVKQIKNNGGLLNEIRVNLVPELKSPRAQIEFGLSSNNIKSGVLEITHKKNQIHIKCDAIFELSVKKDYEDDIKSNKKTWFFGNVDGIFGWYDIESDEKPYLHKYHNERLNEDITDVYHKIDIKFIK